MLKANFSCWNGGDVIETGGVRNWLAGIRSSLKQLLAHLDKPLPLFLFASLESRHEVAIMYFGRASEFLMMTSERMLIPGENATLEQVLNGLRKRGGRWACELDDRHVVCTVNGKTAQLSDTIKPGVEIGIHSRKSIFEP